MTSSWLTRLLLLCGLLACTTAARAQDAATAEESADAAAPAEMTIGSPAPAIDIEHWLSDANGTRKPFKQLESGQVYVIEFWATWCMPCVASMPHLAELQTQYADKGVTIVSISDEPLEKVEEFLQREVMDLNMGHEDSDGDEEDEDAPKPTYAELTSAYCLTCDPDESVQDAYFRAAGQNGIPCAFIVGKTGNVEWIGHPMAMDEVLAKIVADEWDSAAYAAEFRAKKQLETMMMTAAQAAQAGDYDEVYAVAEQLRELEGSDEIREGAQEMANRIEAFVLISMMQNDQDQAMELLPTKFPELDPGMANQVAWTAVRMVDGGVELTPELLTLVAKLAGDMVDEDAPDPNLLDTIAHLQSAAGDIDAAIATQQRAVDALTGGPSDEQITDYLQTLKDEKASPPADDEAAE